MEVLLIITVVVVFILGTIIYINYISTNRTLKILNQELDGINNFTATQKYFDEKEFKLIAVDENNEKVCFIYEMESKGKYLSEIYNYNEILEVEIIENGNSISKTSTTSLAGRALLGGLILGGVGAVIGGITAKKETLDNIKQITLKVVVNNTKKPIFKINFFNDIHANGIKKDSLLYKNIKENIYHWESLFSIIIKKTDDKNHH